MSKLSDDNYYIFVRSYHVYLKYKRRTDFVVDLDNVWKDLGYAQKKNAKELLERNFKIDKDYIISKSN